MDTLSVRYAIIAIISFLFYSPVSYGWTVSIDFEGGIVGQKVSELSTAGDTFYSDAKAYSGNRSAELNIEGGKTGFGNWGGIKQFPSNISEGDEIWVRVRTYMPSSFSYATDFALKFLRLRVKEADLTHKGYTDIYIRNDGDYRYQNELYSTSNSVSNFGKSYPVRKDEWETYIYNVRYSSGSAASVRFWKYVGGTLIGDKRQGGKFELLFSETNDLTLETPTDVVTSFFLFTYWNGGAPKTQKMYVDDIYISTLPPPDLNPPKPPPTVTIEKK